MGRQKSLIKLGPKTLLEHVRSTARLLGVPIRILQHDLIPGCGPLGGVLTALKTTSFERVLFLACDMPFVSSRLLRSLIQISRSSPGVFVGTRHECGFPFILRNDLLEQVEQAMNATRFSLNDFALSTGAKLLYCERRFQFELSNLNSPDDVKFVRKLWKMKQGHPSACQPGRPKISFDHAQPISSLVPGNLDRHRRAFRNNRVEG